MNRPRRHHRLALFVLFSILPAADAIGQRRTENVVLVTLDGARPEEVFGGLDKAILQSTAEKNPVESLPAYEKYWAPTPEARRELILPFFWRTLMAQGSIAGNQALGSAARLTNTHRFSYPGYSEILTGEAQDAVINSNDLRQNPYETVLEFVRRKLDLPVERVAAFTSWSVFSGIAERSPGTITVNAGLDRREQSDPLLRLIDELQGDVPTPWSRMRFDAFTFRLGMAHLRQHKPRLMYFALGETDDWAHDGRYDLVLDAYARTDRYLQALWEWLQSDPQYRNKTTLIVTTDHGRGITTADWRSHGHDVEGAQNIWIAMAGPDHPARGEWRNSAPVYQNQVAATIAQLFGLDLSELRPTAGKPLQVPARAR
jgi:Type I phosphodiesterase / nucleotide pyrophosphatase